jgi:hypothetical protein
VQVGEAKYDVETETRAGEHPFIDTTIYLSGRVLYRRVKTCEDISINTPLGPDTLHERMETQHKSVMEDVRTGVLKFDQKGISPKLAPLPAPLKFPKGIEVRLINSASWLEAGMASLKIEVRGRATNRPAAGIGVEVILEGALQPLQIQAGTDPRGCVSLTFPMPKLGANGGELVIRASGAAGRDELRYRLKAKVREARKSQAQ